jgi:hypothetical protein
MIRNMNSFSKEPTLNGLHFTIHKSEENKKREEMIDKIKEIKIKTKIELVMKVRSAT